MGGKVGAITNRTLLAIQGFSEWREYILQKIGLETVADLGHGVLDAMVETAMYTCGSQVATRNLVSAFYGLLEASEKKQLLDSLQNGEGECRNWRATDDFLNVQGAPIAYWVPPKLLRRFGRGTFLESAGEICCGTTTADDFRFYRLRWEVPNDLVNFNGHENDQTFQDHEWFPIAKGGAYAVWWDDIHLVQNWKNDGYEVKNFVDDKGKQRSFPRSIDRLFDSGAVYPYRTTSAFGLRFLPQGTGFSVGGWAVFPDESHSIEQMMAVFNTRFARYMMEVLLGQGDTSESGTAARNYVAAAVGGIPWPESDPGVEADVRRLIDVSAKDTACETDVFFSGSQCFLGGDSYESSLEKYWQSKCSNWREKDELYSRIESSVSKSFGFDGAEIEAIELTEGPALSEYPDVELSPIEVGRIFSLSVEGLTAEAKAACGAKTLYRQESILC